MNNVQLIGNLTKDPELRQTQNGVSTCSFTVACQRRFKSANGNYESDFINCTAWKQTAEFINKYFTKGKKIALTGSIQTRTYDDNNGVKRYITEVLVDNVEFVERNGEAKQEQPVKKAAKASQQVELTPVDNDDQLPF